MVQIDTGKGSPGRPSIISTTSDTRGVGQHNKTDLPPPGPGKEAGTPFGDGIIGLLPSRTIIQGTLITHSHIPATTFSSSDTFAGTLITQTSTIIPSSSDFPGPPTQGQGMSATVSHQKTTPAIPIGVSLGIVAAVIISLSLIKWRRGRRTLFPRDGDPLLISERPAPPGSVRPYITTQHSQTSNSVSNTNSKARHWLPAAGVAQPPLIVTPSTADVALQRLPLADQNAVMAEQLQRLQERVHQIESIARITFVAEDVPPPEYASNRATSTR
ncbi:hypothetical protein GALMADRAFT_138289 [Galerina marginata CBS 339.88]|uniref:Uncharacterized protein n=1 Tax=Galerina marginata (strain CBS 339.88) TaxID=685588 RepID=A0A067T4U5_GALM3|nr:hypothetical protein GALMADRAFT_138289 [Galerina marginata CBS 339.88]